MSDSVRLAFTVLVGDRPAFAVRRQADANHDGALDATEQRALADRIAGDAEPMLTLRIDGTAHPVHFDERSVGLATPHIEAAPLSVDLIARVALGPGVHELTFQDRFEPPSEGESEVLFEEAPEVRVETTFRGPPPGHATPGRMRFTWAVPRRSNLEDRTVGVRFRLPGGGPSRALVAAAGIVGLLLAAGMALWIRRRGARLSAGRRDR